MELGGREQLLTSLGQILVEPSQMLIFGRLLLHCSLKLLDSIGHVKLVNFVYNLLLAHVLNLLAQLWTLFAVS